MGVLTEHVYDLEMKLTPIDFSRWVTEVKALEAHDCKPWVSF